MNAVVERGNLLGQFQTSAPFYQKVSFPQRGVEVFDLDTRTIISQANRSAMLQCLVWLAFGWGTYSVFQVSPGAPERSQISLKQAAHSSGLSHNFNQLQNIRLEANSMNVQSMVVDGRQVLHVEATVVFANNQRDVGFIELARRSHLFPLSFALRFASLPLVGSILVIYLCLFVALCTVQCT